MKQLPIPDAAVLDTKSVEFMRVWVAQQGLHCSLNVGVYQGSGIPEERAWGTILADAARHVASALKQAGHAESAEVSLRKIYEHFVEELDDPTSGIKGDFVRKS